MHSTSCGVARCREFCENGLVGDGKVRACAGCHRIAYCSVKCQKLDWKVHKAYCRGVQALSPPSVNPLSAPKPVCVPVSSVEPSIPLAVNRQNIPWEAVPLSPDPTHSFLDETGAYRFINIIEQGNFIYRILTIFSSNHPFQNKTEVVCVGPLPTFNEVVIEVDNTFYSNEYEARKGHNVICKKYNPALQLFDWGAVYERC
jgi:hypothetical protein